jgi:uncharacterized protein (DUF1778 family)
MTRATDSSNVSISNRRLSSVRSVRLGLRTTPEQNALIQRAAEATRKSITEFVLTSACEKAEQTLLDQKIFMLDEQTWKAFQDVLERPVQPKSTLKMLLSEPAPWEK